MTGIDWAKPATDEVDHQARLLVLADADILNILEIDPRDEIFGTLIYWHPKSIPMRAQVDGIFEIEAVLAQLIVTDLVEAGLLCRTSSGDVAISTYGLTFAQSRFEEPDVNSICRLKAGAPPYGTLSAAATIALKHMLLHNSVHAASLLKDVYHPTLGRAILD